MFSNKVEHSFDKTSNAVSSVDTRNPMLNPVVLSRFFDVCNSSDLAQFRLVSRQWNTISHTSYREEMAVVIHESGDPEVESEGLLWRDVADELNVSSSPDETKPFRVFRLRNLWFWSSTPPSTYLECRRRRVNLFAMRYFNEEITGSMYSNMKSFWETYGHWIKVLDLKAAVVICDDAFKKAFFEDNLPNLEELQFEYLDVEKSKNNQAHIEEGGLKVQPKLKTLIIKDANILPICWKQLFILYPNIKKLELVNISSHKVFSWIVEALEGICDKLNIKELVVEIGYQQDEVKKLMKLPGLKLDKLKLDLKNCEDLDRSTFSTAIRQHLPYLRELTATTWSKDKNKKPYNRFVEEVEPAPLSLSNSFPFTENSFSSLTKLKLEGLISKNLHFLEQFPNLKILNLCQFEDLSILRETDLKRMESVKLTKLKEFEFYLRKVPELYLSEEEIEMFIKIMPNLECFGSQLSNKSLRVVCQKWLHLRRLGSLLGGTLANFEEKFEDLDRINDEGITGIVGGCESSRFPNITDLKSLQMLTIMSMDKISDASVWKGFLNLPHLHTLNVSMSHKTSQATWLALNEMLPQGEKIRNAPYGLFTRSVTVTVGF